MTLSIPVAIQDPSQGFKVEISRGQRIGRVSAEWFSRPHDERYLSLNEPYEAVRARAELASARTVENGTEFILCCPEAYAEVLAAKVKTLERPPPAVDDEAVMIETFDPAARKVIMVD